MVISLTSLLGMSGVFFGWVESHFLWSHKKIFAYKCFENQEILRKSLGVFLQKNEKFPDLSDPKVVSSLKEKGLIPAYLHDPECHKLWTYRSDPEGNIWCIHHGISGGIESLREGEHTGFVVLPGESQGCE